MITKTLYSGKGFSYSPTLTADAKPTGLVRLIADDAKALTDGIVITDCIDIPVADIIKWSEVVKPPEPIPLDPVDELPLVRAELDRYKRAVAGVVSINTSTALKGTLVDAVNRLKVAVGPIAAEPIVKTP